MKQQLLALFLAVFLLASQMPAGASATPSAWAADEVANARNSGIVPLSLVLSDYQTPITRSEMCALLVTFYSSQSGEYHPLSENAPFGDVAEDDPFSYSIIAAYELGLISGTGNGLFEPERSITREEAAKMIAALYALFGGEVAANPKILSQFRDAADISVWAIPSVAVMAEKEIIKGKTDGAFHPKDTITVEESILMVGRMLFGPSPDGIKITSHSQNAVVSSKKDLRLTWTGSQGADYDVYLVSGSDIQHVTNTKDTQALIPANLFATHSAYRIVVGSGTSYSEPITLFTDSVDMKFSYHMNNIDTVGFSWDGLGGVDTYTVTLTLRRNTKYAEGRISPVIQTYTLSGNTLSVPRYFHTDYTATLSAAGITESLSFSTGDSPIATNGKDAKEALVYPEGRFETQEDSLLAMENIKVPVWKLGKNGEKTASSVTLTVNAKLAPILETVFKEIYNDPEAFPVVSAGGYTWRNVAGTARLSEHAYGTAVDLNPDQNYCITEGSSATTGTHWTPGEDPYSIPAFSSVVRIFEKYGFTWGGDAWNKKADYMHFSYFGT